MTLHAFGATTPAGPLNGSPTTALPAPSTERWQPLRLGLVDLFYYDYEEFWFRDGRLLLRGNNGTGKSKVLALTLPFLLDGEISAARVEPDGDPGKRMEWNLLLGGRYTDRLGYAWIELGRVAGDGTPAYTTVGCGLKAAQGRGIADRWYFLTPKRVGQDLFLISPSGTALSRDRLTEALGADGYLTQRVERHRRAVDEHLFQLGAERYDALIQLLIQLRQPQLSRRPDAKALSLALSQALAPVDDAVLGDVAAAFHDLEQQREELLGLRQTRAHVDRFHARYRRYAQVAARRQAAGLRSAQSAYESVGRDLTGVRGEIERVRADTDDAATRLHDIEGELTELNATREELTRRPELANIDEAERHTATAEEAAAKAVGHQRTAAETRDGRRARRDSAVAEVAVSRESLARTADEAASAAGPATLARDHAEAVAALCLPDGPAPGFDGVIQGAEAATADAAGRRDRAVSHVLGLAETAAAARSAAADALRILREREGQRDAAADRRREADAQVDAAVGELVEAWRSYVSGLAELSLPDPEELGLAGWAETLDGDNPARAALREAETASHARLARAHAAASGRLAEVREGLEELRAERERLLAGEHKAPPSPYTRPEGVRDERPGAPLWQLIDFREDAADAPGRAGLEAALEASGLLDAWVTPDGRLLDAATHDVIVVPCEPTERSLADVLSPAIDPDDRQASAVTAGTVRAVLAGIGLGESAVPAWVDADGRWQVGPLRGSWAKEVAEYVGYGAREEARRRRLAQLARDIGEAEEEDAAAGRAVTAVEQRQERLVEEVSREPAEQPVRDAHTRAAAAARELDRVHGLVEQQEGVTAEREGIAAEAEGARDEAAADLRLPADPTRLREVQAAVQAYRTAIAHLLAAARRHRDMLADLVLWEGELRTAEEARKAAEADARAAAEQARVERGRLAALREALGSTLAEIHRRLDETRATIGARERERARLRTAHEELVRGLGNAEGRERELAGQLDGASEQRGVAADAFYRFAVTGLLTVAAPDVTQPDTADPWAPDPAVRLARRVEQALAEVDAGDEDWRRVQQDIDTRYRELSDALSVYGHHAVVGLRDGCYVVTILYQGRERSPGELAALLADEVEYRERMLNAKERELLEEHLVNDVASHLQELISEAESQVARMNAELAERPTSTGMKVRLRWEPSPDGPDGLAEARTRLLRQDADLWSPQDRAAVSDFLQRQIQATRNENEDATWQENLATALDYRSWHRFTIERWQEGRWRPASAPASGGERVLTVTLPLFAAASAHYRSASPYAPRLVLLDEVFAGVDDDARSKALGLLATFDLDVMMTSEREWGFYATVPGIATHQLARREGIDAVHVTTWEWDGRSARTVERAFTARRPGANGDDPAHGSGQGTDDGAAHRGADGQGGARELW